MPPSEPLRVFISYARKDGAALAQRLQSDLTNEGFDAWLDAQRIKGGATWTTDIEHALDEAGFVLALMTSDSYISEICRAEQLRALRKHKCVIPLKAQSGADVPLHLEAKNYRDFTADSSYAEALKQLLEDLHARNGIELKQEFRETYVTAPPLPVNFVERPDELKALRDALMTDDGGRHIALTALQGMGGIGKTVLAQVLCHDDVVQQAFPDGVVWVSVGKESTHDLVTQFKEVAAGLGDDPNEYTTGLRATHRYRNVLRKKAALIVVDDIWSARDIEPFRAESPRSRLLFTTRDANIAAAVGAREHFADLLTAAQSREVFARWSGTEVAKLPPIAAELIKECGNLPLALSMVGAMLRGKSAAFRGAVLGHLRKADLEKIRAQFPDYPYTDVLRAIQVSVDLLDPTARERYIALAVLLDEMAAAPLVQQCLWGVDEDQAAETADQFVSLSLAQRDEPEGSIRLHDLQLDYVRAQFPKEDTEALELIHGAVRLSSNAITRDPGQFASQLVGRLLPYRDMPAIGEFSKRVAENSRTPWLRSMQPVLHPPGTGLLRTLAGHTDVVLAVAVTAGGQRAVSASKDKTLKVWDLARGRELCTLSGHSNEVTSVSVTPDGQRAVSASADKTLKVWELGSGRELRTLTGHSDRVYGVSLSEDGRLAVSASRDKTLKVWEVESGRELRTLDGHSSAVRGVALSADGRLAVSASSDKTLKVWDVDTGRNLFTLQGHSSYVYGVAVTADGRRAVSASDDRTLKVWDVEGGSEICTLEGHSDAVWGAALSADGHRAFSASRDRTLKMWDVEAACELRTMEGHSRDVNSVAVTADGRRAVSACDDHTLKVWDVEGGREPRTLTGHSDSVHGVALRGDGQCSVSASSDKTLKVWDVEDGRELRTLEGHSYAVRGVALSEDGRRAVSASSDRTLRVWDVEGGHELRTLEGHSDRVNGVALSDSGRLAVSASDDHTLKVWDVEDGRELRTLEGHSNHVNGVALGGNGRWAISASDDCTIKVWDVETGRELRTFEGHSSSVRGVALSDDGLRAVSASGDTTLKVWDMETGRELLTLEGHSAVVRGVAICGDGRRAISVSRDKTLKVWNLDTGRVIATFTCDTYALCCAFSDALKLIVAGDAGGHLHFLRLEEPKPKR